MTTFRHTYFQSKSFVRILGTKSDTLPVSAGLGRGCPLSSTLFVTFMERITRHSWGEESVQFGHLWIASLLFAEQCGSVGFIRHWPLRVSRGDLRSAPPSWGLGSLLENTLIAPPSCCPEWRSWSTVSRVRACSSWRGTVSAAKQAMCYGPLNRKAKLSIFQFLTLTYVRIGTEKNSWVWIQVGENSFFR